MDAEGADRGRADGPVPEKIACHAYSIRRGEGDAASSTSMLSGAYCPDNFCSHGAWLADGLRIVNVLAAAPAMCDVALPSQVNVQ
jgi:hypothetical protein